MADLPCTVVFFSVPPGRTTDRKWSLSSGFTWSSISREQRGHPRPETVPSVRQLSLLVGGEREREDVEEGVRTLSLPVPPVQHTSLYRTYKACPSHVAAVVQGGKGEEEQDRGGVEVLHCSPCSLHPSLHPSISPSIYPSIHPSIHPPRPSCDSHSFKDIHSLCSLRCQTNRKRGLISPRQAKAAKRKEEEEKRRRKKKKKKKKKAESSFGDGIYLQGPHLLGTVMVLPAPAEPPAAL
ncbi:hypothetical protein INR49_000830 [Caranx melampygus]|nr:hypothetical protein INR49_000830 [Caranx melampygus]